MLANAPCWFCALFLFAANPGPPFDLDPGERLEFRLLSLDSGAQVATWKQSGDEGLRSYYAISRDGVEVQRSGRADYTIHLRLGAFDPAEQVPAVPAELRSGPGASLFLVQFITPAMPEFTRAIEELGGVVHQHLPHYTVVALLPGPVRAAVADLPFVRWVGPLHPAYRLGPGVAAPAARSTAAAGRYRVRVAERGPRLKREVGRRIEALGGTVAAEPPGGFLLEALLSPAQVRAVAGWDEVLFIDPWTAAESDMDLARSIGGAVLLEQVEGFTGQGVRGEVMDDNFLWNHQDLVTRPLMLHGLRGGDVDHGTPAAAISFGSGSGAAIARGMVPAARGIFADYHFLTDRHEHTAELLGPPYFASYQSNSWGHETTTEYTNLSAELDDILFLNDIVVCQSQSNAGNEVEPRASRPEAWAKNVVAVGGVRHQNTLSRADDSWSFGASIGPASDGRIKPDLVHFYDAVFTAAGNGGYGTFCCTSAATAIVAGHFGLLMQMWHEGVFGNPRGGSVFHRRPHAATAKALMINGAYRYPFNGPDHDLTRVHQGWGMPDLAALYDARDALFIVDESALLAPFQIATYELTVPASTPELRVTLVYTDPAGSPLASIHRVNDLTLEVISPDQQVYYGNVGLDVGNVSTPGGDPNTIDTVENVFILDPPPGVWTVRVRADEVNEDAHLETPELDADFALVVSGVIPPAVPEGYPDHDSDSDVDLVDHAAMDLCRTGPLRGGPPIDPSCAASDCDGDGDVDILDVGCLMRRFTGGCGLRITAHPQGTVECLGGAAAFEVQAEGDDLHYQWTHNGALIAAADQPTLHVGPISGTNTGLYEVLVYSGCAVETSAGANLTVFGPPQIIDPPQPVTACIGNMATFEVTAAGIDPLSYQWQRNNQNIPGAQSPVLVIDPVSSSDFGQYRCRITDGCGRLAITTQVSLSPCP